MMILPSLFGKPNRVIRKNPASLLRFGSTVRPRCAEGTRVGVLGCQTLGLGLFPRDQMAEINGE